MINERQLIRTMNGCYKKAGYRVGVVKSDDGTRLVICGGDWLVRMEPQAVSNDVKALVVLHTGELPGRAVLAKDKDGPQFLIAGELEKILRETAETDEQMESAGQTPIQLRGLEIWQGDSGECRLFEPALVNIFEEDDGLPDRRMSAQSLCLEGIGGAVYLHPAPGGSEDQEQLRYLSGRRWVGTGGKE